MILRFIKIENIKTKNKISLLKSISFAIEYLLTNPYRGYEKIIIPSAFINKFYGGVGTNRSVETGGKRFC